MVKLGLAKKINIDQTMWDPEREVGAVARTSDLVEEMGQVTFIFSDKTGTLTANEMVFARCCIHGSDLGDFRPGQHSDGKHAAEIEPEGVVNSRRILGPHGRGSLVGDIDLEARVRHFFTCLAVCHSVQVAKLDDGSFKYSGMSPDEIALVDASKEVGVILIARENCAGAESLVRIRGAENSEQKFEVLHELEFNSDRKRMSVVVRVSGEVMVITKGADSAMEPLLDAKLVLGDQEGISRFSMTGLRTLIVASRTVGKDEYKTWQKQWSTAQGCLDDTRASKVDYAAALLEVKLQLVGITAVEDRLQDDVPKSIETLKKASIRLWVLTGDKTETAVDIARSCLLFTDETTIAYATQADDINSAIQLLQKAKITLAGASNSGLVLDGKTILSAMQSDECKDLIYDLGLTSQSCVCCRLSPKQKRELVELVRDRDAGTVTLSIGDGANDVPMIEGAHIGIGVRGKEGAQAVQVADVAISEFRFLVPLLLCHGRRSYWRVALFLNYYLYKSIALAMGDLIWMHQNNFEGGVAFPEYLSVNYNVFFTSWHIVLVLAFDIGVSDDFSRQNPDLYLVGQQNQLFNPRVFSTWIVRGVFHGSVCWLVPNLWYGGTYYDKTTSAGKAEDFWVASCSAFCMIVVVVMLKLLLDLQKPYAVTALGPSFVAFLTLVIILGLLGYTGIGEEFQPNMKDIPGKMIERSDSLLSMVVSVAIALSIDVIENMIRCVACRRKL